MKHVLSLEQQGMMASPSSSSSHLSPAATHVVGSNDGEADGMCEGEAVGPGVGEVVGDVDGGAEEVSVGDNDGLKVGLEVKVAVGSTVVSVVFSGAIAVMLGAFSPSLLRVPLRESEEVALATMAFSWRDRDRRTVDARKAAL